jgi:hypothetical protein
VLTFGKNYKMANKRELKKNFNALVNDVIDECFYIQELNPSKKESSDNLINEAADFYNTLAARIHLAKSKADFREIVADMEAKADDFVDKLNALNG